MPKNLLVSITITFLALLFPFKTIHAQGVGIHHYNLGDIEKIKAEMAAGMPVTLWANPGDGNLLNELNEYNKSLDKPVVVTIEDPEGGLSNLDERLERNTAWVATLGQLSESPVPIVLMTSNEDFTWRCGTDESCYKETAMFLAESNADIYNKAIEAGAASKFILASPMLNITHPHYYQFVNEIQQAYANSSRKIPGITPDQYPALFGLWLLNEYVTIKPNGSYYLPDWQSAWSYDNWGNMKFFAKEFGVRTDEGGVTYDRGLIEKAIIEFFLPRWIQNPSHLGGTILNLEGLVTPEFLDFLKEINKSLQNRSGLLSGEPISPEDYEKYKKYIEELLKKGLLVKCPNGGYATSLEKCKPKAKPKYTCSTSQQAMKPTTFRPAPCESCSDPLPPTVDSCGTPFKAFTNSEWCLDDVTPCDSNYTKTFDWGGDIKIDFTQTKVPFAGYGKSDETDSPENPSTVKYLADYFDGILFYGPGKIKITLGAAERVFSEAGVFRKLAPAEVQDDYKLAMIGRAHRSQQFPEREKYPIRDYVVQNPDPKNHPDCQDKKLTQFITQLGKKPMRRSYNSELEYQKALKEWEEKDGGCWRVLWTAVPMFTREDGVGQIYVQAQSPGSIKNNPFRATFPHLPRLYEVTQALQKLLFPQWPPHSIQLSDNSKKLLASAEKFSPTLLAQGEETEPQNPFGLNFSAGLSPTDTPGVYRVNWTISPYTTRDDVDFVHWTYEILVKDELGNDEVVADLHLQFHNFKDNPTLTQDMGGVKQVFITPGVGDVEISVRIIGGSPSGPGIEGDPRTYLNAAQVCTIDEKGNITGCGVGQLTFSPKPAKVCKSPDSGKACFDPKAKTDDNPNDPICVANSKNGVLYTGLDVPNYQALITRSMYNDLKSKYDACMATCGDEPGEKPCSSCEDCSSVELSRWISIKTKIPWLSEIWKQTTAFNEKEEGEKDSIYNTGLFHIFTPAVMETWQPKQAKTPIAEYGFEVSYGGSGGGASPDEGELYYPKLGGVEEAKQCLTQYMLLPSELSEERRKQNPQEFSEICPPFRKQ